MFKSTAIERLQKSVETDGDGSLTILEIIELIYGESKTRPDIPEKDRSQALQEHPEYLEGVKRRVPLG